MTIQHTPNANPNWTSLQTANQQTGTATKAMSTPAAKANSSTEATPLPDTATDTFVSVQESPASTISGTQSSPSLMKPLSGTNPTAIDRQDLTTLDKAAIRALQLDNVIPGGSTSLEVEASAEVAAVLGVDVGAKVNLSVARSLPPNQDELTLGLSAGGSVKGSLNADTAGFKGNVKAGGGREVGVELQIDLSKPGEATNLAGFVLQAGTLGTPAAAAGLEAVDRVTDFAFGRDVTPGTPIEFIRNHISSISLADNAELSPELGAILGGGVDVEGTLAATAGGTIEVGHKADGSPYVSAIAGRIGIGANGAAKPGVGAGGIQATSSAVQLGVKNQLEAKVSFNEDGTSAGTSYAWIMSGEAQGQIGPAGGGYNGEIRFALDESVPGHIKQDIALALAGQQHGEASRILLEEALPHLTLKGTTIVNATVQASGEVSIKPSWMGAKAGGTLAGKVTHQQMLMTGEVELSKDGLTATFVSPDGEKTEVMKFASAEELFAFLQEQQAQTLPQEPLLQNPQRWLAIRA